MSPSERESHLASSIADLIEGLIGKAGYRDHWLADEFRSSANLAVFRAARRFAGSGDEEECRKYAATSIFHGFANVRKHYNRRRRKWTPLAEALDAGYHPTSREVAPDALASIREEIAIHGPPKHRKDRGLPKKRPKLTEEQQERLRALIAGDPGRGDVAIAREFYSVARVHIFPSSVRHVRAKMGLVKAKPKGKASCASK